MRGTRRPLTRAEVARIMARLDELDRAGQLETSDLLIVAAELVSRGNVLPRELRVLAKLTLAGFAEKLRRKRRGRQPLADTARARDAVIAAILVGERPAAALKAALGERYEDSVVRERVARAARRAKLTRTKSH
jgi:hypothetical protein